jgi:hypothetical protein
MERHWTSSEFPTEFNLWKSKIILRNHHPIIEFDGEVIQIESNRDGSQILHIRTKIGWWFLSIIFEFQRWRPRKPFLIRVKLDREVIEIETRNGHQIFRSEIVWPANRGREVCDSVRVHWFSEILSPFKTITISALYRQRSGYPDLPTNRNFLFQWVLNGIPWIQYKLVKFFKIFQNSWRFCQSDL